MPTKTDLPLTDEERARRLRELAEAAANSDDPEAFKRVFNRVVTGSVDETGAGPLADPSERSV